MMDAMGAMWAILSVFSRYAMQRASVSGVYTVTLALQKVALCWASALSGASGASSLTCNRGQAVGNAKKETREEFSRPCNCSGMTSIFT